MPATHEPIPRLLQVLKDRQLVAPEKLQASLLEQTVTHENLGKILVRNGFLQQSVLFDLLLEVDPTGLHDENVFQTSIPAALLKRTRTMVVGEVRGITYLASLSRPEVVRRALSAYVSPERVRFTPVDPERLRDYLAQVHDEGNEELLVWERLMRDAMRADATDVHIIPRHSSYTVMMRIDGVRHLKHEGSLEEHAMLVSRLKDLSRIDLAERRRTQDGGFELEHNGRVVTFRTVTLPTIYGEYVVVRISDPERANIPLNALGITENDTWRRINKHSDGLVLVTGATGSGKSTTLAATARDMNFLERAIFSVEDPVENRIAYVGQLNTNPAVGLDFAYAGRAFLRADPDVNILGEMRDKDAVIAALRSSQTGHLVLSTLHLSSVTLAADRLRTLDVPLYELRHALRGILAQTLVRKLCTHCHGTGCRACEGGYRGRALLTEVVHIQTPGEFDRVMAGEVFWRTLEDEALDLLDRKVTSSDEINRMMGYTEEELRARRAARQSGETLTQKEAPAHETPGLPVEATE
jgi:general secretion pathway protein E